MQVLVGLALCHGMYCGFSSSCRISCVVVVVVALL